MPKKKKHSVGRKNIPLIIALLGMLIAIAIGFYAGQKTADNRSHASETAKSSNLPTVGKDHICMIKSPDGWTRIAVCRGRLVCSSTVYVVNVGHGQVIQVRLCK